jgi:CHAD domain-containing protein
MAHDARRCLKRLRALIRLVRPALGDGAYRRETERVAGAGRLLAGARDVHVMRLTASKLESRFGPLPDGAGKRLQAMLTASAAAIPSDTVKDGRAQALKRLKQTASSLPATRSTACRSRL